MLRRRRELEQLAALTAFATNDPKQLKREIEKIAPLMPEKVEPEISEYGEVLVNGFVQGWWEEAQRTA